MFAIRWLALVWLALSAWLAPAAARAQVPTADAFLPPVQGGPAGVKQPEQVAMRGETVVAATPQDAMNAAVAKNVAKLQSNVEELGARMVEFPSGLGFVATGAATYPTLDNPTAMRLAKRKAYVVAYVHAKKNLAEVLGGLSNEGKETVRQALVNINLPESEMTNIASDSEESLRQTVEMMLRGFVIYEVKDDTSRNTVYVSIVTTPKTRVQVARPASHLIDAGSLPDALEQVIAEVRSGLVPPVGTRIIRVRSTGETAFIGFGSAVVGTSDNDTVQLKLNVTAQRIADMRAKDALCGLIVGDKNSWEGRVVDTMKEAVQEFESLDRDDPLARRDPAAVRELDQVRQSFVNRVESSEFFTSVRQGKLPPGVHSRTWFDEDRAWAYGMSVYYPSLGREAEKAGQDMQAGSAGFTGGPRDVPRPGTEVGTGPTGKIDPE